MPKRLAGRYRRFRVLLLSSLAVCLFMGAFVPIVADYGLESPQPVSPYLNGIFPAEAPGGSGDWEVVNAFPNLTFVDPLHLIEMPDGKFLITGKRGRLWTIENDPATTTKTVFLDIEDQVFTSGDAGVLGTILHPEYGQAGSPNRGYLYVFYRYTPDKSRGGLEAYVRLSRFTVPDGSNVADRSSELVMIQQYDRHDWHNGGGMFFGPDGFLYITVGDEGGADDEYNSTQTLEEALFSGILRIDVDQDPSRSHPIRRQPISLGTPPSGWPGSFTQGYYIPNDNPWLDPNGGLLEEFYAIGLRSPHRMTYDAATGNIWIGDIGQGAREEVSIAKRGDNLQWPYKEGSIGGYGPKPSPLIGVDAPPVYDYPRDVGSCVIGGLVYRGNKWASLLDGKYIFGDHTVRNIWAMDYDPQTGATDIEFLVNVPAEGVGGKAGISSFHVDSEGELYVLKLYGTNLDGGKILKLQPRDFTPEPPQLLSQTGAFTDLNSLTPASGIVPYKVNSPLWSDGAIKKRWIALPNDGAHDSPGEQIIFSETEPWQFPEGTVIIKHFELPIDKNNPSLTRRLETRFIVRDQNGGIYGVTYKWNEDQTDAVLLTGGETDTYQVTQDDGTVVSQEWEFPSRAQCLTCHNANAGHVLGVNTHQLNGDLTYPTTGLTANQLQTWNHLGMFSGGINENNIPTMPRAVEVTDPNASLELRVKSYIDANCAHCHQPNGVNANFDTRFNTPMASSGMIEGDLINNMGNPDAVVIKPNEPSNSMFLIRDNSLGNEKMPPLAKNVIDNEYIGVLIDWINSLDGGGGENRDPVVVLNSDQSSGEYPLVVNFNASGTFDPDNDPLTYVWNFGDGTQGFGPNVSHAFISTGTFIITLTVTDGQGGTGTASTTLEVYAPGTCITPINLALDKPATQSSTYAQDGAQRAVDGNTDGNKDGGSNSVSHTLQEPEAWWEVNLESIGTIDQVKVYNRTDCCFERLSNFYVLVSDVPFISTGLTETINQPGVSAYPFPGQAGTPSTIDVNRTGQYVRIQLVGDNILNMAEVEVMGCPNTSSCENPPVVNLNVSDPAQCGGNGTAEISYSSGTLTVRNTVNTDVTASLPNLPAGTYSWEVIDGDCQETGTFSMTDPTPPVVSIAAAGPFTEDAGLQTLNASPAGGTWSGAVNPDGTFDPSQGPGTYAVSYSFTDPAGCSGSATLDIEVLPASGGPCTTPENLALGKVVTQSSTYGDGVAAIANDGDTDGSRGPWGANASITHTNEEAEAWWEIDLGTVSTVNAINLFNRTDCCDDRLSNFYVLISEVPFSSQGLAETLGQPGVTHFYFPGAAAPQTNIAVNGTGRYVRVQLSETNILSLAEVEVIGCPTVVTCETPPVVTVNASDPLTCGGTGQVDITYSAGTLTVRDALDTDLTSSLPNLPAGAYTWEVVEGACVETGTFTLTDPAAPAVAITPAGPFTTDAGLQPLLASPSGGQWGGAANPDGIFDPAQGAGIYDITYTYTDGNGCSATDQVQITVSEPVCETPPVVTVDAADPVACGGNGVVLISTTSGVLSVRDAANTDVTASLPNLPVGAYTWEVVDGACVETGTFSLTDPTPPVISLTPAGPFVEDEGLQVLAATPVGGSWSGPVNPDGTFDPSQGPGTYTVSYSYTDPAACTGTANMDIEVLPASGGPCATPENLALNKVATQSSTYGDGVAAIANDGDIDGSRGPWNPGASITHTNEDPEAWWEIDLGEVATIDSIVLYNRTDCCNDRLNNFYVLLSETPFSSQDLTSTLSQPGVVNFYTPTIAPARLSIPVNGTGQYVRIQLVGANFLSLAEVQVMGCASPPTCTDPPVVTVNATDPLTCGGTGQVDITYSAGILSVRDAANTDVTASLPNLPAGAYTWEVVDGLCVENGAFTLSDPNAPVVSVTPVDAATCGGLGSVDITYDVGTLTVRDAGNNDVTASLASLPAGDYTWEVANGTCVESGAFSIGEPALPAVSITPAGPFTTDQGLQPLAASPAGGTWSGAANPDGTFDPSQGAGTYKVYYTYTDGLACTKLDSLEISVTDPTTCTDPPVVTVNATDPLTCGGTGQVDITYSAGTLSVRDAANTDVTASLPNLPAGAYTWEVVDGLCVENGAFTLSDPNAPVVSVTPVDAATCGGLGSVDITYDVGTLTVRDAASNDVTASLASLPVGDYTWEVANGTCVESGAFSIGEPALPAVSITPAGPFTTDQGLQPLAASPAGGTWSGAANPDGTFDPSQGTGTYKVYYTYTDGLACTKLDSLEISVTEPTTCTDPPVVTVTFTDPEICGGLGTADITYSSGVLRVTDGLGADVTGSLDNLPVGAYNWEVVDGLCLESGSFTLADPDPPVVSVLTTDAATCGGLGSVDITFTIGQLTVKDAASNDVTASLASLPVGDYTWEVANGTCGESGAFSIGEPALPVVSLSPAGPFTSEDGLQTLEGSPPGGTWSGAANPDGTFDPSQGPGTYTVNYTFTDGVNCTQSASIDITVTPPLSNLQAESGIVDNVGSDWITVALGNTYTDMVVVASVRLLGDSDLPVVSRVRNAVGNSFELKVQNPSATPVSGYQVHYLAVEAGVYSDAVDGIKMEAVKANSDITASAGSWNLESRSYNLSFSNPVVLGQVMTDNDPNWSVFWASSNNRANPPAGTFSAGKMVGEDPNGNRAQETIGYIIFEAGNGVLGGDAIYAAVGANSVKGIANNSGGYSYAVSGLSTGEVGIVSAAGINGGNGGWPVLAGNNPVSATNLQLAYDEDQINDNERNHTNEQVAYVVIGSGGESARFARNTAVLEPKALPFSVRAYPNPFRSHILVNLEQGTEQPIQVEVSNMMGQVLYREEGLRVGQILRLGENWAKGVYLLKATQGSVSLDVKMVKTQ